MDIAAKQYAPAIERVQKLIDKDPKLAQPWALRAKIYLAQQDFTHAEADLLKAIDLDPNLAPGYLLLAQLYVATNKQEQAIEKLKEFGREEQERSRTHATCAAPPAAEGFCCSSRRI